MKCAACGHRCAGDAGRPRQYGADLVTAAAARVAAGESVAAVARDLSVSRATLYRRLKELREQAF